MPHTRSWSQPVVIAYHRHCPDGATAAWIARTWLGQRHVAVRLLPLRAGEPVPLPEVTGAHLLLLDTCPPAPALDALQATVADLVVLDHHQTALDLAPQRPWLHADAQASAALLTWRWCHGDAPPPPIVAYVDDMDLW